MIYKNKKMKPLLFAAIFLIFSHSLFAVDEYVSEIYKELDKIFTEKSENALNSMLAKTAGDKNYYLIENYAEKKIRRLIVNNEYDFAITAITLVIENNLENQQAVEMYSVISAAYEKQKNYELEREALRQKELEKIEREKEKQRVNVEKKYVSVATAENGKSVYVSGKAPRLSGYSWKANLGIADLAWLTDAKSSINNFQYGISLAGEYEYNFPNGAIFGGDIFADGHFLSFFSDRESAIPIFGEIEGVFKFAFAEFSENIFARLGFGSVYTGKDNAAGKTADIADTLATPVIGVAFQKISLPFADVNFGADWYAGHLFAKTKMPFAMGVNANFEFPFATLESICVNLNIGIRDKIFIKTTGFENRIGVIFAVGVKNVVK